MAVTRIIETDRLILRAPEHRDEPAYVAFYGSERRAATGVLVPEDVARTRFADVLDHWAEKGFGRFIVESRESAEVLGMIGPHHPAEYPEAEIAWHLWSDNVEGKGIAFEAALAARKFAYDVLGWTTAVSYIAHANLRSAALAKRLGAVAERDFVLFGEPCQIWRHPSAEDTAKSAPSQYSCNTDVIQTAVGGSK